MNDMKSEEKQATIFCQLLKRVNGSRLIPWRKERTVYIFFRQGVMIKRTQSPHNVLFL